MLGDKLKTYEDFFGPDAYVREPFIWDVDKHDPAQTSWEKPAFSTDSTVIPQKIQERDPASLLNFYKKLIRYRNTSKPLTQGSIAYSGIGASEIVSFRRIYEAEETLVVHNVSDVEVTVKLTGENSKYKDVGYFSNEHFKLEGEELTLPAFSTVILK
jgi:glycosidase